MNEIFSLISFLICLALECRKANYLPNLLMLSSECFHDFHGDFIYSRHFIFEKGRQLLNFIKTSNELHEYF